MTLRPVCGDRGAPFKPRDRIVAAAVRLFLEEGIQAVGMARIIKEAGVAQMTPYRQFGGKEGVVVAAIEQWSSWWIGGLLEQVDRCGDDPETRYAGLWRVVEQRLQVDRVAGSLAVVAAIELRQSPPHPAWKAIAEHRAAMRQLLEDLVKPLEVDDPRGLVARLELLIEGAVAVAVAGSPVAALDLPALADAARR
jgi:AcrR family transcriptional regulator